MADQKLTDLPSFTPIVTDLLYGVDDPGGTPASGQTTIDAVLGLYDARTATMTNKTVSDALTVGGDADAEQLIIKRGATQGLDTPSLVLEANGGTNDVVFAADSTLNTLLITESISTTVTGTGNIVLGLGTAGDALTSGTNNTLVGSNSGQSITTGDANACFGFRAGEALTTGTNNLAIGTSALRSATTPNNNVAIGSTALRDLVSSNSNVAVGSNAALTTTGANNVAIGTNALLANVANSFNMAIGASALVNSTSDANTAVGQNAGGGVSTGANNTAIGRGALSLGAITGTSNSCVGVFSLQELTGASTSNVGIGFRALEDLQTGSENVAIGAFAGQGSSLHDKSGGVFIGYSAGENENTSNKLYIANSNTTTPLIYGEFDNDILTCNGRFNATDGIKTQVSTDNVSDPPTDAELDTAFGTPATLGEGFIGILDDNSADTDVWLCYTSDTSWFYLQGTKAV